MDGMVCRVGQEIQYSEQLIKAFEPKVFELKHPVLFVKYLALAGRAAVYADTAVSLANNYYWLLGNEKFIYPAQPLHS